ncbi:hypothetical protein PQC36_gp064 [Proteus phage Vb_PmiP-P59]|uniref:Uncharacterized protein n=1 Tax=Proteus phage Vb_PmiP-P59 TaxID=2754975 RepID=A0A7G5CG32_9CAUD|nr:hypothetical protein PQC36_gp064 [Proteus phage Vb_PmiP-P59]QMV48234.1 hypothetical protein [Proteus phage Vb_PmiP-P59]
MGDPNIWFLIGAGATVIFFLFDLFFGE